jgi:hypothetical protein
MLIIVATFKLRSGGIQFQVSLVKFTRTEQNNQIKKGLEAWLKE